MATWIQLSDEFGQQFSVPLEALVEFGHLAPSELSNNRIRGPITYISVLQNGEIKRIKCTDCYDAIRDTVRGLNEIAYS